MSKFSFFIHHSNNKEPVPNGFVDISLVIPLKYRYAFGKNLVEYTLNEYGQLPEKGQVFRVYWKYTHIPLTPENTLIIR